MTWKSIVKTMLTLNVLCISESYIEIKIKLNFLFSHFFVVPQKVVWRKPFEAPKRSVKKNNNLIFSLCPRLGHVGLSNVLILVM